MKRKEKHEDGIMMELSHGNLFPFERDERNKQKGKGIFQNGACNRNFYRSVGQ